MSEKNKNKIRKCQKNKEYYKNVRKSENYHKLSNDKKCIKCQKIIIKSLVYEHLKERHQPALSQADALLTLTNTSMHGGDYTTL